MKAVAKALLPGRLEIELLISIIVMAMIHSPRKAEAKGIMYSWRVERIEPSL